jgi:hypothetical protein
LLFALAEPLDIGTHQRYRVGRHAQV